MPKLTGYAVVWGEPSVDLGGFTETFRPGAFTRSLRESGDIFFLNAHRDNELLGSRQAGTLRLTEDATGLRFELDTPATSLGRDVSELVRTSVLRNMSFGFRIPRASGEHWSEGSDGLLWREVLDADLLEVSTTQWPAYPTTSITARRSDPSGPSAAVRRAGMKRRLFEAKVAA